MLTALTGLLFAAFVAATLLPAQSEAVLVALILQQNIPVWLLLLVASIGNVLGSVVNWWLGSQVDRFRHHRWFPASESQLDNARRRYHRYGYWSLLLSWMPLIGDPITVVAGVMKEPFWRFFVMVSVAKTGRYLVVVWMTLQAFSL